jgi:DNA-dependent protein kinase catalytic subunit
MVRTQVELHRKVGEEIKIGWEQICFALILQNTFSDEERASILICKYFVLFFRLGLIEWIENTMTLKDLLLSNMSQEEKVANNR